MAQKPPLKKNSSSRSSNPSSVPPSASLKYPPTSPWVCLCLSPLPSLSFYCSWRFVVGQTEIIYPCFHPHKNKHSISLSWGICRGSLGSFELAKEGRMRRLLRQLEGAVQRAEHPAGVIRELLPDLFQDQGPKLI